MGFTYSKALGKILSWTKTYVDHKAYEWECSYAYSSIVGGFLHLYVGIISLSISRREIDEYKVPSTYTLQIFSEFFTNHKKYVKTNFVSNKIRRN
jgi:hypothetical protein